jgi:protein-L-isoaspartate(D-aspartate) O-methyltransferase
MEAEAQRARLINHLRREIEDERVLRAMEQVPRELFVPETSRHLAYEDIPLPIGEGQTISQPYIIALMTQSLQLTGNEKVLEVGTGSGYQAAILAKLVRKVVSVERIPLLAESARRLLEKLGYTNIEVHVAGKTLGWPDNAPYEAIIVTAGAPSVPQALLDQLALGGRLAIPVGSRWDQELLLVTKQKDRVARKYLVPCRFVPLIGEEAWSEE